MKKSKSCFKKKISTLDGRYIRIIYLLKDIIYLLKDIISRLDLRCLKLKKRLQTIIINVRLKTRGKRSFENDK